MVRILEIIRKQIAWIPEISPKKVIAKPPIGRVIEKPEVREEKIFRALPIRPEEVNEEVKKLEERYKRRLPPGLVISAYHRKMLEEEVKRIRERRR